MLRFLLAFADDCWVKSISDGLWEGVNVVIAVNFDCFARRIANYKAVMAPLQVLFQLRFELDVNIAVQVLIQFFKEVFALHCGFARPFYFF